MSRRLSGVKDAVAVPLMVSLGDGVGVGEGLGVGVAAWEPEGERVTEGLWVSVNVVEAEAVWTVENEWVRVWLVVWLLEGEDGSGKGWTSPWVTPMNSSSPKRLNRKNETRLNQTKPCKK